MTGDRNWIHSTWLRGLYYGNAWFREIDKEAYFTHYSKILMDILSRPTLDIKIACLKEDPDVTLGYSVFESIVLHYIFVKPAWREIGIAKDLLPSKIEFVTHLTKVGKAIKPKEFKFNPFL